MNQISIGSYQAATVSTHANELDQTIKGIVPLNNRYITVLENGQLVKKRVIAQADQRTRGADSGLDNEIEIKRKMEAEKKSWNAVSFS